MKVARPNEHRRQPSHRCRLRRLGHLLRHLAVLNGATCNGHIASHCHPRVIPTRTGGWPSDIGLDTASRTIYVTNNVDGTTSLLHLGRR